MRLMRFNATAEHAPGKTLAVADALSRGPEQCQGDGVCHEEVTATIEAVMDQVPAIPHRMAEVRQQNANDRQLQTVIGFIRSGWPDFESKVPESVKDFYKVRGELSEVEGLVTRGH